MTKYQYDSLDRLTSVTDSDDNVLVETAYDQLGNMTRLASTNSVFDYTYDPLNRVTNGTFYAQHNQRGDITLARAGTATVGRYDYSAFGALKSQVGPDVCRFKFSSKEREAPCGFSYYGYRFYAPQWQRWLGGIRFAQRAQPTHTHSL